MKAYCMACRKMVEMKSAKIVKMKNGMYAYKGKDSKGHTVYKIKGKKK